MATAVGGSNKAIAAQRASKLTLGCFHRNDCAADQFADWAGPVRRRRSPPQNRCEEFPVAAGFSAPQLSPEFAFSNLNPACRDARSISPGCSAPLYWCLSSPPRCTCQTTVSSSFSPNARDAGGWGWPSSFRLCGASHRDAAANGNRGVRCRDDVGAVAFDRCDHPD